MSGGFPHRRVPSGMSAGCTDSHLFGDPGIICCGIAPIVIRRGGHAPGEGRYAGRINRDAVWTK